MMKRVTNKNNVGQDSLKSGVLSILFYPIFMENDTSDTFGKFPNLKVESEGIT